MHYYITYFEIAAFAASLLAWNVIRRSRFLRLFPLLLFVIVAVEVYETFFAPPTQLSNAWIYNIQVPLQYLFYLTILYYAIKYPLFKKLIIAASFLLVAITIITNKYFAGQGTFNSWSYSFGSATVIICILVKFYEMLQNPTEFNFIFNPFFYILFAFLLFNVGTLPYFIMGNWLWFEKGEKQTVIVLQNVMSILNYMLYSTYTIAFLWIRKKASYS
jgi:hypothetical protein